MFYHYTDIPYRGKVIRLLRSDDGQPEFSDGLLAVARLTQAEAPDIIPVIKGYQDTYHVWRTPEEQTLWQAYREEHPILFSEYYGWTRANAEI